jgi:demethylmenaquinone methyltransferase/2-methoxy-6-polyprenyl-1,4-benzoquinol methylase
MNVYDAMAPDFERRRSLPDGVAEAVRGTILQSGLPPLPRLLDLGAGTGRIGRPFVLAGDDYTGADLSFGMLKAFAGQHPGARLTQADGARLPFADAAFDAVMLVQILNKVERWRHLLTDTIRVLRPGGIVVAGRVAAPDDGVDARMKDRLAAILEAMDVHPYRGKFREDAMGWLARALPDRRIVVAATWIAQRTPDGFLERHAGGARFRVLPEPVKQEAMHRLRVWAAEQFGSLDTVFAENYRFELIIHRHQQGTPT